MVGEPQIGLNDKLKFFGVDPSEASKNITAKDAFHFIVAEDLSAFCAKVFSLFHPLVFVWVGRVTRETFFLSLAFQHSVMLRKAIIPSHGCGKEALEVSGFSMTIS